MLIKSSIEIKMEEKLNKIKKNMPSEIFKLQLEIDNLKRENDNFKRSLMRIIDLMEICMMKAKKDTSIEILDAQKQVMETIIECFRGNK